MMKNVILIMATLLLLVSCKKKYELDQLPPATKTGENTAGCFVNGALFVPKGGKFKPFGPQILGWTYDKDGKYFYLYIRDDRRTKLIGGITLTIELHNLNGDKLESGKTYKLTERSENSNFGKYLIKYNKYDVISTEKLHTKDGDIQVKTLKNNDILYSTTSKIKGALTITYLQEDIVSGTFWFNAVNKKGEIIKVRKGRFDFNLKTVK